MFLPSTRAATHVMVNFRVKPAEKQDLDALTLRLNVPGRSQRYKARGWAVSTSDVLRWGLEALRRELDADQAAAEAAEYNAKHPARKAPKEAQPATKRKSKK